MVSAIDRQSMNEWQLTFSLSDEIVTVFGSRGPSDAVVSIEFDSSPTLFLIDDLKTIIVDKHVGGSTLQFIR